MRNEGWWWLHLQNNYENYTVINAALISGFLFRNIYVRIEYHTYTVINSLIS